MLRLEVCRPLIPDLRSEISETSRTSRRVIWTRISEIPERSSGKAESNNKSRGPSLFLKISATSIPYGYRERGIPILGVPSLMRVAGTSIRVRGHTDLFSEEPQ